MTIVLSYILFQRSSQQQRQLKQRRRQRKPQRPALLIQVQLFRITRVSISIRLTLTSVHSST